MTDLQTLGVILAPLGGALLGGLFGYVKAKRANPTEPFKLVDLLETIGTGVLAGLLWLGSVTWSDASFGIPVVVSGVMAGAGFDYMAKKTILP
jgi:hypothetical protein